MSLFSLFGALEIGLIFSLVALGVLISFRILNFPNLTVDGSFPIGGTVAATLITSGHGPFMSTLDGALVGAITGFITGWLNVRLKIMDLLAGILMMIMLYSVNLRIMGKPNVPLVSEPTIFSLLQPGWIPNYVFHPVLLGVVVVVVKLLVNWFFLTQIGLSLRTTSANPRTARVQGVATDAAMLAGIALSNAPVILADALYTQTQGNADVSMGVGTIVVGLAAVIIGEVMLPTRRLVLTTLAVVVGAILYHFFTALALNSDFIGPRAQDLSMITAALVVVAPVLPGVRRKVFGELAKTTIKRS